MLKVNDDCPKCGAKMVPSCDVPGCTGHVATYSRIVGYMRSVTDTWNPGKQEEFHDRIEYDTKNKVIEQMEE